MDKKEHFTRRMKKEGEVDVTFLNPSVIVDLDYFKPYKDDKELRGKVYDYLMLNWRDKVIINEHNGHSILITRIAIDKLTFSSGESKLRLLLHLPQIIINATPVSVEDVIKFNVGMKKIAKFVYNFESYIRIGEESYLFGLKTFVVNENETYIYSGHLNIKKPL